MFRNVFSIDLRTLAFFRVGLALIGLNDIIHRSQDLVAFYTDQGVFNRLDAMDYISTPWSVSLYYINGSAWFATILFVLTGIAALCLLFGYRTRLSTIVLTVLVISLQNRNPLVLIGGDNLYMVLLVWSCFLPLGARASIDAALNPNPPSNNQHFSAATVAILLQAASLYFFTALLKSGPEWWPDGTAVYYALNVDHLARPFGVLLRDFPLVMQFLTYAVLALEYIGPILLFCPFATAKIRIPVLLALISMHLGFHFGLSIGWFSFISLVSISNFIPGFVWDKLGNKLNTTARNGLVIYYDEPCGFCKKVGLILRTLLLLPSSVAVRPAQHDPIANELLDKHFTWVLKTADSEHSIKWQALAVLFQHSPLFWPLGNLMALSILNRPGTAFYDFIGRNRGQLAAFSARYLPYSEQRLHNPKLINVMVGVLTAYTLAWNISTLPSVPLTLTKNTYLSMPAFGLRLHQSWTMFAPHPAKDDTWVTIPGTTRNGQTVDVRHRTFGPPDSSKAANLADSYENFRWNKYFRYLWAKRNSAYRVRFAYYMCKAWDQTVDREPAKLAKLAFTYHLETTLPDNQTAPAEELIALEYSCPAAK